MSGNGQSWNVSMIAWGEPSDPRAFSGYSHYLTRALKKQGNVRREFSAKCISYLDVLSGAFGIKKNGRLLPKPVISRSWMWSDRGQRTLTRRFGNLLRASGDTGPMLQVGTLVEVPRQIGPHFMLTDMTIAQAEREGMFDVGRMNKARAKQALDVQRRVLHSADHLFVLSDWCRQSMIDDFDIDGDKVTVIYAGSNLLLPSNLTEPKQPHEVLFVGIDWKRKGGPLLLEAFKIVKRKLPSATLRIVGCQLDIQQDGVYCEGFLDKRDANQYEKLQRLYLRASVFCLPSLFDPFPNVIIEAASVGLPSVAVDNGSRREAVLDGVTGSLALEPTPQAVAEALLRVLENPAVSHKMGVAARQHAAEHFTWDRVVEKIGRVVQTIAAPPLAPAAPTVGV